jgi:transposase
MSNVLKVSLQETICTLDGRGWSRRRIARELGIDRETVGRYLRLAKPAISIPGSEEASEVKPAISTAGNGVGRKSQCEPLAEVIRAKVEVGLSAQRIYQDLVEENGFTDSYQSVKRFVHKLRAARPERIWRMECQPGEEVQPDFGLGAPIDLVQNKRRRSWVLRLVPSYSRKGYSEAVIRQDTETFIRCLENGLRSLGGSPLLLNLDNMKSAVLKADWFDPEINPKLADFCRHYGMHVVPCRPGMPQHKGKVERGVATFGKMLSRVGASDPWPRKTTFLIIGKAVLPTSASTARHASKWLPVLKRSGHTSNHCLNRSFPGSRKLGAVYIGIVTWK